MKITSVFKSSLGKFQFKRFINLAAKVDEFSIKNEPMLQYLKGSKERKELTAALTKYQDVCTEIPIIIGGQEIKTDRVQYQLMPFDHKKKVAKYYWATPEIIQSAINNAESVREKWEAVPISEKINLCLKAADLVSGKYRMDLNAATMLGQGKTAFQAEIDAAAELADFLRFNAYFAKEITKYQPQSPEPKVTRNTFRHRGIEGFVAAISPFNFTAIGGNLATAPALMGNVVLWKPSDTCVFSNYIIVKVLQEAGFPPGVINFVPADGPDFGSVITRSPLLAGINFTGSGVTFNHLWKETAKNLEVYKSYPRLIGECSGKNFHFIHKSADVATVVASTIRASFEYSGQKCSACSRIYVPDSLWPKIKEGLLETRKQLKVGSPLEFDTFMSAVIDKRSFQKLGSYIDYAKSSKNIEILGGGDRDDKVGYYVQPTIVQTTDPKDRIMKEDIFGPLTTVFVYPENKVEETLKLVSETTPYALTGAIFSKDENFTQKAVESLKMSAGNFYINDKSTGAVVGQQPFGGARLSGTNDKAGGPHYLLRWTSPQVVKETFVPLTEVKYPYMEN